MPAGERDSSPQSSISSAGDPGAEVEYTPYEAPTKRKKRIRVSKKEIPGYRWKDEATRKLADFVKDCPELYDKRQKDWLNVDAKSQLWTRAGEQQDPPATGAQCKKQYENMRTRVGKIMKREQNSGAGQAERSVRDQEIMETWNFLTQHIVRCKTTASEEVSNISNIYLCISINIP